MHTDSYVGTYTDTHSRNWRNSRFLYGLAWFVAITVLGIGVAHGRPVGPEIEKISWSLSSAGFAAPVQAANVAGTLDTTDASDGRSAPAATETPPQPAPESRRVIDYPQEEIISYVDHTGLTAPKVLSEAKDGQVYRYTVSHRLADKKGWRASVKVARERGLLPADAKPADQIIVVEVPASVYKPVQREARRVMLLAHALSAIDGAITISCTSSNKCVEGNPIYGKNPSPLMVIGIKGGLAAVSEIVFQKTVRKNPWEARRAAYWSLGINGGAALLTMTQAF